MQWGTATAGAFPECHIISSGALVYTNSAPPPPSGGGCQSSPSEGGGALAQGLGIRLFAFGGAYWPLSPLLILTLRGPERVLVVSTEPPDDLSCLTTPGGGGGEGGDPGTQKSKSLCTKNGPNKCFLL